MQARVLTIVQMALRASGCPAHGRPGLAHIRAEQLSLTLIGEPAYATVFALPEVLDRLRMFQGPYPLHAQTKPASSRLKSPFCRQDSGSSVVAAPVALDSPVWGTAFPGGVVAYDSKD